MTENKLMQEPTMVLNISPLRVDRHSRIKKASLQYKELGQITKNDTLKRVYDKSRPYRRETVTLSTFEDNYFPQISRSYIILRCTYVRNTLLHM